MQLLAGSIIAILSVLACTLDTLDLFTHHCLQRCSLKFLKPLVPQNKLRVKKKTFLKTNSGNKYELKFLLFVLSLNLDFEDDDRNLPQSKAERCIELDLKWTEDLEGH